MSRCPVTVEAGLAAMGWDARMGNSNRTSLRDARSE